MSKAIQTTSSFNFIGDLRRDLKNAFNNFCTWGASEPLSIPQIEGTSMMEEELSKKRTAEQSELRGGADYIKKPRLNFQKNKKQIEKEEILRLLNSIMDVELSTDILTDIIYKTNETPQFIVVGRPKVTGSYKKQMRHITPFSFVKKIISHMVENTAAPGDLLAKLIYATLPFIKDERGFCFNNEELKSTHYQHISKVIKNNPGLINKSLQENDKVFIFLSKNHETELFNSPTKKNHAIKEYSIKEKKFVEVALTMLKNAIFDTNTMVTACEALTRYMFILFNQRELVSFPEEGNTLNYEIRLYKNPEEASMPHKKQYEIMTSREIKQMLDTPLPSKLLKCIRIVCCEGPETKKASQGLKILDMIIKEYNLNLPENKKDDINKLIKEFNLKSNLLLKLDNSNPDLCKYNKALELNSIKTHIEYQIAKLLFYVFDFKALEKFVFVPGKEKNALEVYNSATGANTAKYFIMDGPQYRKDQINKANKYNDKVTFRKEEADPVLLATKAAEHIHISLFPFSAFHSGFSSEPFQKNTNLKFVDKILKAFTDLIKLDHCLGEEKTKDFDIAIENEILKFLNFADVARVYDNVCVQFPDQNYDWMEPVDLIGSIFNNNP